MAVNQIPLRGSTALQAAAAQTATNTSPQAALPPQLPMRGIDPVRGVVVHVIVTAVSGTSPTLVVKLQDSPDGTNFADTGGTSASINATGVYRFVVSQIAPTVQAVSTIAGTTPSFTYSIQITGTP